MSYYLESSPIPTSPDHIPWPEIKYWLNLDDDHNRDGLLALAARMLAWAEDITGSTLVQRNRTVKYDGRYDLYELPAGPINSVASITDAQGNSLTSTYARAGTGTLLDIASDYGFSRSSYPLTVVYNAGYPVLPATIKQAVLMAVAAVHRDRENPDLSGAEKLLRLKGYGVCLA